MTAIARDDLRFNRAGVIEIRFDGELAPSFMSAAVKGDVGAGLVVSSEVGSWTLTWLKSLLIGEERKTDDFYIQQVLISRVLS